MRRGLTPPYPPRKGGKTVLMPNSKSEIPEEKLRLIVYAATGWLVLFLAAFFNVEITDPAISRWQIWSLVPELLDFIDPPADVAGLAGGGAAHSFRLGIFPTTVRSPGEWPL